MTKFKCERKNEKNSGCSRKMMPWRAWPIYLSLRWTGYFIAILNVAIFPLVNITFKLSVGFLKCVTPGLCSSRAQWPLVPNFCPRATRKSQIFHTNYMLGTLQFSLEHSLVLSIRFSLPYFFLDDTNESVFDRQAVAFRDVNPVAPKHILVIPRKPLMQLSSSTEEDIPVCISLSRSC